MYVRKMMIPEWEKHIKLEGFNHPNLVKLLGYCTGEKVLYSVYELNPGTSLDRYLYEERGTTSLSWVARLNIAIGAAEGLVYLHKRNKPAYCLFTTSRILVDTNFNARLSDFAYNFCTFLPNRHYASPEWFRLQEDAYGGALGRRPVLLRRRPIVAEDGFAMKNEIYSFGVVLLEILTGMKVYDYERPPGKKNLMKCVVPFLAEKVNLGIFMDPQLQQSDCPPKGAFMFAQLVSNCLQPNYKKRPSMEEILQVLKHCYQEESKHLALKSHTV